MSNYIIGIDTSNYKTSVSVVDERGEVVFVRSEFLDVKRGEKGIRQQTAFFMHNNRLPDFIDEAFEHIDGKVIAVAASDAPRRVPGSYMPVFIAGLNAARILAVSLRVPLYQCSHQEGHIEAVVHNDAIYDGFSAGIMHLSGGTTEILKFELTKDLCSEYHYYAEIIGGTKDISVGQLLDRIGVKAGFDFPAGKYLDEIALNNVNILDNVDLSKERPPSIRINQGYFNLSGIETEMIRSCHLEKIPFLMYRIADLIHKEAEFVYNSYGINRIYMCGGVSQSEFLRKEITKLISANKSDFEIIFGDKSLCGDNAVGVAWLVSRNI